ELPAVLDPVLVKLLRDVRVHANRDEPLLPADRFLELARELVLSHEDIRDLVLADQLLELAVGDGRDRLPPDPEVLQGQHAHHGDEHVREIEAGLLLVHVDPVRTSAESSMRSPACRAAALRSRRLTPAEDLREADCRTYLAVPWPPTEGGTLPDRSARTYRGDCGCCRGKTSLVLRPDAQTDRAAHVGNRF